MKINFKGSDLPQPKTDEPKTNDPKSEPKQAKAEVTAPSDDLSVFNMASTSSIADLKAQWKTRWRKWNMARLQSQYTK